MKNVIFRCLAVALVLFGSSALAGAEKPLGPKALAIMMAQASQAFKTENYARAIQLYGELTALNPKDALAWQFLGQALAQTHEVMGAQRAFARVLEIQPTGQIADSTREMLANMPLPDLYAMKIDSGLTLGDWMPLAETQVRQGKRQAVLEKLKQYLEQFGSVPQLLAFQARLQQEIMAALQFEDAETAKAALPQIRELLAQTPANPDALRLEARACHIMADYDCADAAYSSWLKISAGNSPERKEVVNALMQARQHLPPDNSLNLPKIGVTLLNLTPKQAELLGLGKAGGGLIKTVEKDSPADKAGIQVGDVLLELDGKALSAPADVLRIAAEVSPGSNVLGQLWRDNGRKKITMTVGEKSAAELAAQAEQAAQALKAEDYARAVLLLREVVASNPQDAQGWHFLGQALAKTDDGMGARRAFARVLEIQPDGKLADGTREMLAKLPEPDLFAMPLDSGLTLGDWMNLAKKQNAEGRRDGVLRDISEYLNQFGPVPQLLALQAKLQQERQAEQEQRLQSALAAIKVNDAGSAAAALPQIRQIKTQAAHSPALMRLEARACHLVQDYSCAEAAYAAWLKAAPESDQARNSVVDALLLANRREALPLPPPTPAATGEIIRDCDNCPEMVVISKGAFEMGAANAKHTVIFAQSFAIGRTEVTQGQWQAIMGSNPSHFQHCGDNCPVEMVSWEDVQRFIKRLNAKTDKHYRLPSEAEWEAACRAGKEQEYCGSDDAGGVAWYGAYAAPAGNSGKTTHPVATRQANAWGLYDMSGNVWEWVEDSWHDSYYGAPANGEARSGDGLKRVIRGGSWVSKPQYARASHRDWEGVAERNYFNGFRLVRTLP